MFDRAELDRLIDAMCASRVTTLEIRRGKERLRLVRGSASLPATARPRPMPVFVPARSPAIGAFLARGIDDGLPPLEPGAPVREREVLGYVCQGPVRTIVVAPATGVLITEAPLDGTLLGYGDTVFTTEVRQ